MTGHLRGRPEAVRLLRKALTEDEWSLGQAELLYGDGVYFLHVAVKTEFVVPEPEDSDTLVGVDINERNVALTALDRESMDTLGTLVIDYGSVKAERQRFHTITKRRQEHGQDSIHQTVSNQEERYTEWVLSYLPLDRGINLPTILGACIHRIV